MIRYTNTGEKKVFPEIDKFLEEIKILSKKYNLSISHEDTHGSFVIEKYSESNLDWLKNASVDFF